MFVTYQEPPSERFDKHCLFNGSRDREIISVDGEGNLETEELRDYYEKPKGLVSVWRRFDVEIGF